MTRFGAIFFIFFVLFGAKNAIAQTDWYCEDGGNNVPSIGTAQVRLVFVAFSDTPFGDNLPTWTNEFISEMQEYYDWSSNGKFHINLQVPTPPGQPGKAWLAPNPSTAYKHPCGDPNQLDISDLNAWVVQQIYTQLGSSYWNGVQSLYITYIGNPFLTGNPIPRGVAALGLADVPNFNPASFGFTGRGVSQGFDDDVPLNSQECKFHLEGAMAHEFGHNLGRQHIPHTDPSFVACGQPFSNSEAVNMGRYAIMDSWTGPTWPLVRPWSHHPYDLVELGWVSQQTVWASPCTTTITIPDIRDPVNGKVVAVHSPLNPSQYFLLANVEGTGRDADLGATGLLIWHIWPSTAWDLESARGKVPDAVNGHDPLEGDACEFGTSGDIFDGSVGRNAFTPLTNPNTNFYASTYQSQPVVSGIYMSNIRKVGTNMLVDIYLDQPAQLTQPASGSFYTTQYVIGAPPIIGGGIPVQWASCGSVVDIQLSDATGTVFTTVADDIPNQSSYHILGNYPTGSAYRVKVIPDNNPAAALTSGPFIIWNVSDPTVGVSSLDCQTNSLTITSSWSIQPTVQTSISVTYYPDSYSGFYTNSGTANSPTPSLSTTVPYEAGLWHYNMAIGVTGGQGVSQTKIGTFEVNGNEPGNDITNFAAYSDSVAGVGDYFYYQYKVIGSWTTSIPMTSQLEYRVQGAGSWSITPMNSVLQTGHYVKASNLQAGTTYEVRAVSQSASGCTERGPISTVTTKSAFTEITGFDLQQEVINNGSPRVLATCTFNTGVTSSCAIQIRKHQATPIKFGTAATDGTADPHGTSHSHEFTDFYPWNSQTPSPLAFATQYDLVITVWPGHHWPTDPSTPNAQFPDGFNGYTVTKVYVTFTTPTRGGGGSHYEFTVANENEAMVAENALFSNNPNPFASSTGIRFAIKEDSKVRLEIFDLQGRVVRTLANEAMSPGLHEVYWDRRGTNGERVNSGIYFYRLTIGEFIDTKKMVVLR